MRALVQFLALILIALSMSSCATIGSKFEFNGPEELNIGSTTKTQVYKKYGEPFRVGWDSGKLQWTYGHYIYRLFGRSETKDLIITFDKQGRVEHYVYNSSLEEEKIKMLVKDHK